MTRQPPADTRQAEPRRRRRLWRLLTVLGSVLVSLLLAEIALRLAGFSYEFRASIIQGANARDLRAAFDGCVIDRDLLWVPHYYDELLITARAAYPTILCLGDSCTECGRYSEYLAEYAGAAHPERDMRVARLGVTGWSTFQGLRQLRRDVPRVRPRVVTIYFGWNDHWNSIGLTDQELAELNASPLFRLRRLRLGQLAARAYVGLRRSRQAELPLRVPPEEFRENLVAMVAECRTQGIVPVLLTALTSHAVGSEPERLAPRWITNLADLVSLHRLYVDIVRDVAREHDVVLCDLAARFDTLRRETGRSDLFQADGIHLTPEGDRLIARCLFDCFEENGLFDSLHRPVDVDALTNVPP